MRRLSVLACAVVFAGLLVAAAPAASALPVVFLECEDIYGDDPGENVSFRLGNNLDCDGLDGLNITASGIIVDLGGHRLRSDNTVTTQGVSLFSSNNVTIRNGVIDSFEFGVLADGGRNIKIRNLVIRNTQLQGIRIHAGDGGNVVSGNTLIQSQALNLANVERSTVSRNTLVATRIHFDNVDRTTVSGNRVLGQTLTGVLDDNPSPSVLIGDGSQQNTFTRNQVLGSALAGIEVDGGEADRNTLSANTIRASGADSGISIIDGDDSKVLGNTLTANPNGIVVSGDAEDTVINGNTAIGNIDTGIEFGGTASGRITNNVVNENGVNGIEANFTLEPVVSRNTANFNGYTGAADEPNDSSLGGIVVPGATGSGNRAKGNDVAAGQCDAPDGLCIEGSDDPPPLLDCGAQIQEAHTLHHPMVCGTTTAIPVSGSGYTLNLGPHLLDGGSAPGESALEIRNLASDITVTGGVMTGSTDGIHFTSPAVGGAHGVTIRGALVTGNADVGIRIQGEDATPDDATVTGGRNRIHRTTIIGPGTAGVAFLESPRNTVTSSTLADNGVGVLGFTSAGHVVRSNTIIGGDDQGMRFDSNATSVTPDDLVITRNRVTGTSGDGIQLTNVQDSVISSNVVRGSTDDGIGVSGNSTGGAPNGSNGNAFIGNVVTANDEEGIEIGVNSQGNRFVANTTNANGLNGLRVFSDVEDTVIQRNIANENGADNFLFGGIVVEEPMDGNEVPDIVSRNSANRNGFLNAVSDDIGLGIVVATDTDGTGNRASGNDNPVQCSPNVFC